jgi:DNA-binding LytR/AlgR family response regulator
MGGMQEILDPEIFVRAHKSYIVSINYIEAVRGNELSLKFGSAVKQIPIGATFKESILKKLRI